MVKHESLELKNANIDLTNQFLLNAGRSLKAFRYFDKRSVEKIYNHLITTVLIKGNQVIGYGHLEREIEKVWLGIALIESQLGKGYGLYLISALIVSARDMNLQTLHLSVDKVNLGAIRLYEKVGFIKIDDLNENTFLMKMEL